MDEKIDANYAEEEKVKRKLITIQELVRVTEADHGVDQKDRRDFIKDFDALHFEVFEGPHLDQVR